ncbi:MAG TPA: TolC family protein, partial [Pirellulales bacterium]|nr:TolC family protein [Pirellulales bacterium]
MNFPRNILRSLSRPSRRLAWACLALLATLASEPQRAAAGDSAIAQASTQADSQVEQLPSAPQPPAGEGSEQIATPPVDSVVPVQGEPLTIDLQSAWRLAGVQNPTINAARMAIVESEAVARQAALVWLPNLNAGTMYHRHIGSLLASGGQIRRLEETSLYFGGGARTVAAESNSVPMIQFFVPIADGLFNPLAARQLTAATRYDAAATNNSILLDTTVAYFDLLAAETQVEAYRLSRANVQQVVDTTSAYAQAGQGREGDAHRAAAEGFLVT